MRRDEFVVDYPASPGGRARNYDVATPFRAQSGEVDVATEMLVTKAQHVADDGACAGRYA